MKTPLKYAESQEFDRRTNRRFSAKLKHRNRKSYFTLPNTIIEMYASREISEVDIRVYAYLSSLSMRDFNGYTGVKVTQKRIAARCEITENTVSASTNRLIKAGLIKIFAVEHGGYKSKRKKYIKETYIYNLQPLPESGFFFCSRNVFNCSMPHKMFTVYLFFCRSHNIEYGMSWNSFNDICLKLGFGKNQRSEVIALIDGLVKRGLIKKTKRRVKKAYVDNIYRILGLAEIIIKKNQEYTIEDIILPGTVYRRIFDFALSKHSVSPPISRDADILYKSEKRPVRSRTFFLINSFKKDYVSYSSIIILPPIQDNVKSQYEQLGITNYHDKWDDEGYPF